MTPGIPGDRWSYTTVVAGAVLAVIHGLHSDEMLYYGTVGVVLEGLVPLFIAAVVGATGPALAYTGYRRGERRQVVKWMAIGSVLVGLLFAWTLSHQYVLELPFPHREYVMTTNLTVGALLGAVIGLYDVRTRRHRRAVEEERATITHQRTRLSVLNRVLRHNLRNDATVIMGNLEEIARSSSGDVAELAQRARQQTQGLVDMSEKSRRIDDALSVEGPAEVVELSDLVEDSLAAFAGNETVELEIGVPDGLTVRTHPGLLAELLQELVSNAIDHGERPVAVTVGAERGSDGSIELRVVDDGPGIPAIERASLDAGIETDLEHTSGLGLWFVRWGVDTLGGEVDFEDRQAGGTAVRMRLPGT